MTVTGVIPGCSYLLLTRLNAVWQLYLFFGLMAGIGLSGIDGIAHGGIFTVISPIVAELFGIRSHGALFGVVAFSGTVGGAIGPVLAGLFFDLTRSYHLIFMALTGLAFISLLLTLLLRPAQT